MTSEEIKQEKLREKVEATLKFLEQPRYVRALKARRCFDKNKWEVYNSDGELIDSFFNKVCAEAFILQYKKDFFEELKLVTTLS